MLAVRVAVPDHVPTYFDLEVQLQKTFFQSSALLLLTPK